MKYSFLHLFGILLLVVNSFEKETYDPDTKYFIYNKMSSKCIKRYLTNNGYSDYYITAVDKCTNDDDSLWYIRDKNIISAASGYCLAIVNSNKIGSKDCEKSVIEAIFIQDFVIENNTICTNNYCLKDRRVNVGDKKNKDEYYEWIISTSLLEKE